MVSQMIAWEGGALDEVLVEGYVAVIQTNSCLVFQLKSEVKSNYVSCGSGALPAPVKEVEKTNPRRGRI